jgi:hypothetical protein
MKKIALIALLGILLWSCSKEKNEIHRGSNTFDFFSGEWQARQLIVVFHGVYNSDFDSVLYVKEEEFKAKLKSRPNTMIFNQDFSYAEIFYDTAGNELLVNKGNWSTHFDTLKLEQQSPYQNFTAWKFTPNVDSLSNPIGVNLYRVVDFDFDGKEDDEISLYFTPKEEEKSWWEEWFD